ncbi:MAG: MBL fold metallo-hydrolase, partial [Clostridia bacterium]|nr:MBL fold metallo-hydrolase [Clostridia bacterium]
MKITELHYSVSNNYLIEGRRGHLLFDTGWAGTLPLFLHALGEIHIPVQSIDYILISHFHPDHMGIAEEIADLGPRIAVMDVQRNYIHAADAVFAKEKKSAFRPIKEEKVRFVPLSASREFLSEIGLDGEILHT